MLISTGTKCTSFWNLNSLLNVFIAVINAFCLGKNAFQKLDKERIVVGGREKILILSIKEKKIINFLQ